MSGDPVTPPGENRWQVLGEQLLAAGDQASYQALARGQLPDRATVLKLIECLHQLLLAETLPGAEGTAAASRRAGEELSRLEPLLVEQLRYALEFPLPLEPNQPNAKDKAAEARRLANVLLAALPRLREHLLEDARAAWRGDPSCRHPIEALYAFPGVFAVTRHRIAHVLYREGVPLLPRLIAEDAHQRTGIDIHPGASIGREFFVDHGTGVVIGETAIVGQRVTVYQGVTLGARSFPVDDAGRAIKGLPRHPIVEDDVTIYASATILGRVTVGRGSIIGGNVWLTHDVPANSRIAQAEARQTGFEGGAGI